MKIITIYEEVQHVIKGETEYDYICIGKEGLEKGYNPGERQSDSVAHIWPFKHGYISNQLTPARLAEIFDENSSPAIVIDAQTGAGKTTLITKSCYPVIEAKKQRMLILSNRRLIKSKIKYDIIKAVARETLELLTPKGIEREHHFGSVDIYSYQDFMGDFPYQNNRKEFEKALAGYGMVIFDEVHFAVSDAGFNAYTAEIMEYLLSAVMKYEIPRIYLTGTVNPVFNYLYGKERAHYEARHYVCSRQLPMFYYCHFQRDYDYLVVKQFNRDEDIIEMVNSSNMKWLIFVDRKSRAEMLQKKIKREKVRYIDATNQEDEAVRETIRKIVDEDTMEPDVLIATTVMDVGINIKDSVNIVSYLTERNSFVQAIGRKRVRKGERVSLYIPRYGKRDLERWISRCEQELTLMDKMRENYPEGQLATGSVVPIPILIKNGRYTYNYLSYTYYKSYRADWEEVLQKCSGMSEEQTADCIFSHFLDWFGKDFQKEVKCKEEKLKKIIDKHRGRVMDENEYKSFVENLKEFDVREDKRSDRELSTRGINMIFKHYKLGCELGVNYKKKQYQIVEIEQEVDKDE